MLQVLDTLAEINERHEAVKELEKSLMELHQIFLDMAVLVEAQGEMLDNIEQQVGSLFCLYQTSGMFPLKNKVSQLVTCLACVELPASFPCLQQGLLNN